MKPSHWLLVAVAVIGLIGLMFLARHKQRVLIDGLPPRIVCADMLDAKKQAGEGASPVLGTGSMVPFIPASPAGADPYKTFVAYAVIDARAGYADITPGKLCVYRYGFDPSGNPLYAIHGASTQDSLGWIGSGLHNARSESWARITPENFVGIVARVYVWPQ